MKFLKIIRNLCLWGTIFFFLTSCSPRTSDDDDDDSLTSPSIITLRIKNRSQFVLEHVFIHEVQQFYKETHNRLNERLDLEAEIDEEIPPGKYRVTVTRLKNQDGPLLAYTTALELNLHKSALLEYFDTEFRLSALDPSDQVIQRIPLTQY